MINITDNVVRWTVPGLITESVSFKKYKQKKILRKMLNIYNGIRKIPAGSFL